MYDIYVVENLKNYNTTAIYSGTNDIQISNSKIIIKDVARMNIKLGYGVKIAGNNYTIDKIVYNDLYSYYTLTVSGVTTSAFLSNQTWGIYSFTSTVNSYKLDCPDLDLSISYQVTDYTDLSTRKDSVTKTFNLASSDVNNRAFSNYFHLNKHTDVSIANKLAFNYTALRPVDVLVYENGLLVLNGTLVITQITTDEKDNITYSCAVTGKVVDFTKQIGDALLTDLDFKEFEHVYNISNILNSWKGYNPASTFYSIGNSTYKTKDPITGVITSNAADYGKGYFYPYIDFGERFKNDAFNSDYSNFKMQNLRPALYLKTYFDKIFSSIGFTYEIKGGTDLQNKFNRLFIPNSDEKLTSNQLGVKGELSFSGNALLISYAPVIGGHSGENVVRYIIDQANNNFRIVNPIRLTTSVQTNLIENDLNAFPNPVPFVSGATSWTTALVNRQKNLIRVKKNFTSDGRVTVSGNFEQKNPSYPNQKFYIQLVRRPKQTDNDITDDYNTWEVLAEQTFTSQLNTIVPFTADFLIEAKSYVVDEQLQIRMMRDNDNYAVNCNITAAHIYFAKDNVTTYTVETEDGDWIVPTACAGVKQMDFIMSIVKQFNFIVYNLKSNPKNIIFQTYDDYYGLTVGTNLKTTAVDWSRKLSKGFTKKSNITIPKNYLFTMKDDSDYLNTTYKNTWSETCGQLKFSDSYGVTGDKKIESIFSPSITANITGTTKFVPYLSKDGISLLTKNTTKTNIRLMYYNGVHSCTAFNISKDSQITLGTTYLWLITPLSSGLQLYPQCSNFLYNEDSDIYHTPVDSSGNPAVLVPNSDIHFYFPRQYNFIETDDYYQVENAYDYYISQTTELTDSDVFIIECNAVLNSVDINNLDLRKPIFLDFGSMGAVYFKVLKVEYKGANALSKLTLQRIVY